VNCPLIALYDIDVDSKLSQWDLEVLSAGITSLGGQWRTALTRDVTHLFALHKQSDKVLTLSVSFAIGSLFTALTLMA
jgi:hypothetical protein